MGKKNSDALPSINPGKFIINIRNHGHCFRLRILIRILVLYFRCIFYQPPIKIISKIHLSNF